MESSVSEKAGRSVRILHLEDDADDAFLIHANLKKDGLPCEIHRVGTRSEFEQAVEKGGFDIILSDYSIPSYSGAQALAWARRRAPETPFVFVSGTIGEDAAVEALLQGATDYVLKTTAMKRLVPAIRRALKDVEARRERQTLEQQYRQAQKMEIVGRLAGGVAHDFNNLLTAILGLSELCMGELSQSSPMRRDLEEIRATALRAAELTRQLLAFSRKQVVEPRIVDLNDLVRGIQKMLGRIIGEDVALSVAPAPRPALVRADPGQLEQLIVNLAVNARDAMPGGGRLSLEISRTEELVRLDVRDTGTGISDEVKAHLFEPFFTTKEAGKGAGLGLATCYGIVRQSGGSIAVESALGRGSVFSVELPLVEGRPVPSSREAVPAVPPGRERLLVVDDDGALRGLAARMLRAQGYRVGEASSVEAALKALEADVERQIRLVISDVIIPRGGGLELAAALRRRFPGVRLLLMSGCSDESVREDGAPRADLRFIAKPFTSEQLVQRVREVIDAPAS